MAVISAMRNDKPAGNNEIAGVNEIAAHLIADTDRPRSPLFIMY